jgi:hypothetical protein
MHGIFRRRFITLAAAPKFPEPMVRHQCLTTFFQA